MALTAKQDRFVEEYLVDLNATQAAIRAGYSAKTAEWIGPQLLGKTHVAKAVSDAMEVRSKRVHVTQDRIIIELARIAFSDARQVMRWGPDGVELIDSDSLSDDAAALVSEVAQTVTRAGGSIKAKVHDKLKALEMLGRHLGMFKDRTELTGPDGEPLRPPTLILFGEGAAPKTLNPEELGW